MNAKKCKTARKLARKLSVGMVAYELLARTKRMKKSGIDPETKKSRLYEWDAESAVNSPRSTRGIYRQIKRFLRQGLSLTTIEEIA